MADVLTEFTSSETHSNYSVTDKVSVFGGENDLWGASEISVAQLKDPNFKIAFDAELGEGTYRVDSVKVEVFFVAPLSAAQNAEIFSEYVVGGTYVDSETVWAVADDGLAHIYVATGSGASSGSLPAFSSLSGSSVVDGAITWTEAGQYQPASLPPYYQSDLMSGTIGLDANGDRIFVIVGRNGLVRTSLDGDTWTERETPVAEHLRGISAGAAGFVAVGDNGVILSSPDGETWTKEPSESLESFFGVDYDRKNKIFVAVGKDGLIRRKPEAATSWDKVQR